MANGLDTADKVFVGRQNVIRGTGTIPDVADPILPAIITGIAWPTGTYFFSIPIRGAKALDVLLRSSAATGTGLSSAATIFATMNDEQTQKGTSQAFATFVNGTAQIVSLTALRGERIAVLKLVVPGASSITFDQAEFSAL